MRAAIDLEPPVFTGPVINCDGGGGYKTSQVLSLNKEVVGAAEKVLAILRVHR